MVTTTYRLGLRQHLLTVLPMVAFSVALLVTSGVDAAHLAISAGVWSVFGWTTWWLSEVTLTTEGVTRRGHGPKLVRWRDIQAVRVEPMLGSRTVILDVGTRSRRLRTPITGPLQRDPDFDAPDSSPVRISDLEKEVRRLSDELTRIKDRGGKH